MEEVRKLLGIPEEERISAVVRYQKKGKEYLMVKTYNPKTKGRRSYHVKRRIEAKVMELIREHRKTKSRTTLIHQYRQRAIQLFEELKPYMFELYKEGLSRLNLLQALYLLVHLKGSEELLKKGVKLILERDADRNVSNPFGLLKKDLFIEGEEYDFLLSGILSDLDPLFKEILRAEAEKEVAVEVAGWIAKLGERERRLIEKVMPLEEFTRMVIKMALESGVERQKESWEKVFVLEEEHALPLLKKMRASG